MCTKVRIANFSLCWNVIYGGQIVEVMFGEDKLTGPWSQELFILRFEGCKFLSQVHLPSSLESLQKSEIMFQITV